MADISSPERFEKMALGVGLAAGLAADLATGRGLRYEEQLEECVGKLDMDDPLLTTVSVPCAAFSLFRALSGRSWGEGAVAREILEDVAHLEFCVRVRERRYHKGALCLREHP